MSTVGSLWKITVETTAEVTAEVTVANGGER